MTRITLERFALRITRERFAVSQSGVDEECRTAIAYPANLLPTSGKHPYEPPKRKGNPIVVKVSGGYLDKYGNI